MIGVIMLLSKLDTGGEGGGGGGGVVILQE